MWIRITSDPVNNTTYCPFLLKTFFCHHFTNITPSELLSQPSEAFGSHCPCVWSESTFQGLQLAPIYPHAHPFWANLPPPWPQAPFVHEEIPVCIASLVLSPERHIFTSFPLSITSSLKNAQPQICPHPNLLPSCVQVSVYSPIISQSPK